MLTTDKITSLIQQELFNIPVDAWGYFFPVYVAVWKSIHEIRPDLLDEIDAGFDTEPYFRGNGADWFMRIFGDRQDFVDASEQIMTNVVEKLGKGILSQGCLKREQIPSLDEEAVRELVSIIEEELSNVARK